MTKATFRASGNHFMFSCTGHAGYASRGTDVVCAAASVLAQTLMRDVEAGHDGLKSVKSFSIKDGDVAVDLLCKDEAREKLLAVWDAIEGGFRMLEKKYPKNVSVGRKT